MASSSVGMTRTATRLAGVLITPAFAALASGSRAIPSQASRSQTAERIAADP